MALHIMYHELERPGHALCDADPGYVRYVVDAAAFEAQMAHLRSTGMRGVSVSDAAAGDLVITFDDGCETDLVVAAPVLQDAGFGATFYVTLDFVGRPGFMTARQVRELADAGFEIGSHALTHSYMPDLPPARMREELAGSKARLEEITNRPVVHFACPGGFWNRRLAEYAREIGYDTVSTSRPGVNGPSADRYALARVAIMRTTDLDTFAALCQGRGLARQRAQERALRAAKRALGSDGYMRLRAAALALRRRR